MKIFHTIQMGSNHNLHCEDQLVVAPLNGHRMVCAVMDGCTAGKESHFASALIGKLIRKAATEHRFGVLAGATTNAPSVEDDLTAILRGVFDGLRQMHGSLLLGLEELLSTLILMVADTAKLHTCIVIIGDGSVAEGGKIHRFDHSDRPDYLAYHLSERFESWFPGHTQRLDVQDFDDIAIATDGIDSFATLTRHVPPNLDVPAYLLLDTSLADQDGMLDMKLKLLANQYGLHPADDLSIIRINGVA